MDSKNVFNFKNGFKFKNGLNSKISKICSILKIFVSEYENGRILKIGWI
jgi:hypothetical protein